MRPDPREQPEDESSGRIIYLGDVRRRKVSRRQSPDGEYLGAIVLLALVGWAVWTIVLFNVPPSKLFTYLAFFAPLAFALTFSGAIVASLLQRRRYGYLSVRIAVLRGAVGAAAITLNLALLAAHRWSILLAAASTLMLVAFDTMAARKA